MKANVIQIDNSTGSARYLVAFEHDGEKVTEAFSAPNIVEQIRNRAKQLEAESHEEAVTLGPINLDTPVPETPSATPKEQWLADLATCQLMVNRIAGVMNPDDVQEVIDCKSNVAKSYQSGFLK